MWTYWLAIGLIAQLLVAPAATVMKIVVDQVDPLLFNSLRGAIVVAIALPFMLIGLQKFTRVNLVYALAAGICMAIATITIVYALQFSQASYVVILSLLQPIILVILSARMLREKVSFQAAAGITIAAFGAFLAVSLPFVISGELTHEFYPLATALTLINCLFFPLGLVFYRKSHEAGLPMVSIQGVMSATVFGVSGVGLYATGGSLLAAFTIPAEVWLGIIYSSVVVIFIARMMAMASMERIGASAYSGLVYLENIIAIIIPIIILGEQLSWAIIAGGIFILIGLFLTEKHRTRSHPIHHGIRGIMRH